MTRGEIPSAMRGSRGSKGLKSDDDPRDLGNTTALRRHCCLGWTLFGDIALVLVFAHSRRMLAAFGRRLHARMLFVTADIAALRVALIVLGTAVLLCRHDRGLLRYRIQVALGLRSCAERARLAAAQTRGPRQCYYRGAERHGVLV